MKQQISNLSKLTDLHMFLNEIDREYGSKIAYRYHVEKMIVEPFVPARVRACSLDAFAEEPQCREGPTDRLGARDPGALDADRIGRERETHGRDTRRSARLRLVNHEAIRGIGLVQEVIERMMLQRIQADFPEFW